MAGFTIAFVLEGLGGG